MHAAWQEQKTMQTEKGLFTSVYKVADFMFSMPKFIYRKMVSNFERPVQELIKALHV